MKLVGIADDEEKKHEVRFLGHKVLSLEELKDLKPDAILITCLKDQASYIRNVMRMKQCNGAKLFTI